MSAQDSSIYHVAASSDLPAPQRYEHWLAPLLSDFEAATPNALQRQNFQGRVSSLVTATSELHDMQSDDFGGSRSPQRIRYHENDKLALVYVRQGQILSRYEGDTDIVAKAGQFVLFDAQRPNQMHFCQQPRFVQINLPRGQLASVLSSKPLPSQISRAVTRSGLANLLSAQLSQFVDISAGLSFHEQLAFLDATEALATRVVESACLDGRLIPDERNAGLYTAAQRYIDMHLDDPGLTGASIAAALGCSRATLYRAFSSHHRHLAAHIRERRLQTLARLLQHCAPYQPIAQLAFQCGLHDTSNVSRLFRQRFGVTPSEFRALNRRS